MRWTLLTLAAAAIGLLGSDCFKPFGAIGDAIRPIAPGVDGRCVPLSDALPPDFAFEPPGDQPPDDRLWVAEVSPATMLVPYLVDEVPPTVAPAGAFLVPPNGDGDGSSDSPMLNHIDFIAAISGSSAPLALLTAFPPDEVLLFDAANRALLTIHVSVPAFAGPMPGVTFPMLPAPGDAAVTRTALSTVACLSEGANRLDSLGAAADPSGDACTGFLTSSTSGAAVAGTGSDLHLFVSMANPGSAGTGAPAPHYLPGTLLVYSLSFTTSSIDVNPDSATPVIYTSGFNPTGVTAYSAGGRSFLLVTVSGAVGAVQDDLATPAKEGGSITTSDAAIDVIDADTLEQVATIPLGRAGLAGGLAVHPSAPLAVVGSLLDRWLLAVDLTPLADPALPTAGPPVILGGPDRDTAFADAVIHDASTPYIIDHRIPDGASKLTCPGKTAGVAFSHAGDRLYVTDFCDGTLAIVGVDATAPSLALDHELVQLADPTDVLDPIAPRDLGGIAVRPRMLGTFTGPDVFVVVGKTQGQLCGIGVESGS